MFTITPMNAMLDRMVTLSRTMDGAYQKSEAPMRTAQWSPALDARETEQAFVVALDLPGVKPDQVDISFEKNTLTVSGTRELPAKVAGDKRVFLAERATGTFSRSLRFPQYVEGGKISAEFDHGVLTVTVPKAEAAKPRKISIGAPAATTVA